MILMIFFFENWERCQHICRLLHLWLALLEIIFSLKLKLQIYMFFIFQAPIVLFCKKFLLIFLPYKKLYGHCTLVPDPPIQESTSVVYL